MVGFCAMITVACLLMGVLGYNSAEDGFAQSLQMKAESNVRSGLKLMEYRYPGAWHIENGRLYKGDVLLNGNDGVVDALGTIFGGHVTLFDGDTRVATTVKNADGSRAIGTKASDKIIETVLKNGNAYTGRAEVVGEEYHCAYEPIKSDSGTTIGMMFVGLSVYELDDLQHSFILSLLLTIVAILIVIGIVAWFLIGKAFGPLEEVSANLHRVADGDLKVADLAITTQDEIGSLAQSANTMKTKLRQLLQNVHNSVETVAASSQELNASATQTTESIRQVADSAIHMWRARPSRSRQ